MRLNPTLLAAGAALALWTANGCSKSAPQKPVPAPAPAPAMPVGQGTLEGTVVEVVAAPPYSYVKLKTPQGETWAALPAGDFKVGAPLAVTVQLRMDTFESPSLHRTFKPLVMGTLAGAGAPAAGHPMTAPAMAPTTARQTRRVSGASRNVTYSRKTMIRITSGRIMVMV